MKFVNLIIVIISVLGSTALYVKAAKIGPAQTDRKEIASSLQRFAKLSGMAVDSPEAIELIFETAKVESKLYQRKQLGGGPAIGLWQMEEDTYNDIQENFIGYRPKLKKTLDVMFGSGRQFQDMRNNDEYAIVMARLVYWRAPGAIPSTKEGRAHYWKKYYNTEEGKGSVLKYLFQ